MSLRAEIELNYLKQDIIEYICKNKAKNNNKVEIERAMKFYETEHLMGDPDDWL